MFIEKIKSQGLAHMSYFIGDKGQAAVIDPRRDIDVYSKLAEKNNLEITHIFETHRNEDYVIGSQQLHHFTGAQIYHGGQLEFEYGNGVNEGDVFEFGDVMLKILSTPGHTFESISIALYDKSFSTDDAVGVFTGDALFIGDVGRTDFFPDRAQEVAGLLYESIHQKLLTLGDQCIIYPAHGAGSVCGSGMASREFSTIGYERRNNPSLQKNKEDFIQQKINEHHYQPPYFRKMEYLNQSGDVPILCHLPTPKPLSANEFAREMESGLQVLDLRNPEAISGATIPGSLSIPVNMLPAFAGFFLSYDKPIGLVADETDEVQDAVRHLVRLGYDNIRCYLNGGLHKWETSGKDYNTIPAVHVKELIGKIENNDQFTLLDVRSIDEFESGHLPGAQHIYVGELPKFIGQVDSSKPVVTFCGSGQRAAIAASYLKQNGFPDVSNCLGSMSACKAVGCPIA
ncbi:MAG: MBL fold metallo-hydrolase [Planctomycetes bacterium GWF2_41_51]|nr:MAG: MBL fold metallo-hydrolase [Planctomycetes bacterium GWF2_41_51]HBG25733.1 MBL fold metallo-hydrolase [Phycisphaerales bacterium]